MEFAPSPSVHWYCVGSHPLLGDLQEGDRLRGRGIQEELFPYSEGRTLGRFPDGSAAVTAAS
ncbi:hypothetical protein MYX84_14755 [Acidobacteria bacterium AH-259-O06]|nr:hypothetical protein [Acidobacteria bacterium AH-259-O06]